MLSLKGNVVLSGFKHGKTVIPVDISCPWSQASPFVSVMYREGWLAEAVLF